MSLPEPVLIGLIGLPAAGKSVLASALSARLQVPVLNRDRIREAMFSPCGYTDEEKVAAETALWEGLRTQARLRRSTIVDGMTFASAVPRRHLRGIAEAYGLRSQLLWLDCPLKESIRRLKAGPVVGDRTPKLARQVAARFEPPDAATLRLDARAPLADNLERVLEVLGVRP